MMLSYPERLLQKVFKCVQARDAAHDPRCRAIWERNAEFFRAKLRQLLRDQRHA
jgi:hypothetical protein